MRNNIDELLKEEARIRQQEEDEIRENPLMQYSTSQLKAELRRRKKERCEKPAESPYAWNDAIHKLTKGV
jgi:hypothetical protein